MMIETICKKAVDLHQESVKYHRLIDDYCNHVAQNMSGDPEFNYGQLPDEIVEALFYGGGSGGKPWDSFIQEVIALDLKRKGLVRAV